MLDQKLLTALYSLGAEIVLTATDAQRVEYRLTFAGQAAPLALALPPGHYVFIRVLDAPGDAPGLAGVSNPARERGERRPTRREPDYCPECNGAGRVALPNGEDGDCPACEGIGEG